MWQKLMLLCVIVAAHFWSSLTASAGPGHIELALGEESDTQDLPCLQYMYYKVEATEACKDLNIIVTQQRGEPNVYVSRAPTEYPTLHSLTWSSYNWGSDHLTISSWDPEFIVGIFYIGVHAFCGDDVDTGYEDARYTIRVESVEADHPHEEIRLNEVVTGDLNYESYKYFRFCIPHSCVNVDVNLGNCIDPAICPTSYAWPELLVSRSIEKPTINDHSWKLAEVVRRSVVIDHDDAEFYPGHFFVGVYGWCTPPEHCPDILTCGPCDNYAINFTVTLTVSEVTSSCKPKKPLGLCEGGFATSLKTSVSVLVFSTILAGILIGLQ